MKLFLFKLAGGATPATTSTVATYSKSTPARSVTSSAAAAGQSAALLRLSEQTQRFLNKSKGPPPAKRSNSLYISEDSTLVSETSEPIGATGSKFLKSKQATVDDGPQASRYLKTPVPGETISVALELECV